jgi:PAS domain S-box-containing protein
MTNPAPTIAPTTRAEDSVDSLRRILDAATDHAIITVDRGGSITSWSRGAERLYGARADEALGLPLSRFLTVEAIARGDLAQALDEAAGVGRFEADIPRLKSDGRACWVNVVLTPLLDGGGAIGGFVEISRDITATKRASDAQRDRALMLDRIVDAAMDAILVFDHDGKLELINPAGEALFGCSAASVLGQTVDRFIPSRFRALHGGQMRAFGASSTTSRKMGALGVVPGLRADGVELALEASIAHMNVGGRKLFAVIHRDARGRLEAEAATRAGLAIEQREARRRAIEVTISRVLAESESLREAGPKVIRALGEAGRWAHAALWEVTDRPGALRRVCAWTATIADAEGSIAAASVGTDCLEQVWKTGVALTLPERSDAADPALSGGAIVFPFGHGGQISGVIELLGRAREDLELELSDPPHELGDRLGQFVARRRAEDAVRRFVTLSTAVLYVLRIEDHDAIPAWVSDNFEVLTGYTPRESGDNAWWADHVHPEDRARMVAAHPFPYTVEHQVIEYRFRRKDGRYVWVRDDKRLLRDPGGARSEVVGTMVDVTERIELESQLRQAQKMEAVGLLAGGVAHDFNNMLTVISGSTSILRSMVSANDPRDELLVEIADASDRATSLTRQLLVFSRAQIVAPRVIDPNEIVRNVSGMMRRLIGEDVEVVSKLAPALSRVLIDPGHLEQVVLNLAVNARDAMPLGGQLSVETRDVELDEPFCRLHPGTQAGRYVLLRLTDTGSGMTPEVKAHIFEPFFTTKGPGRGTGLGLATVFGIVKQSGGTITVQSDVGAGTCFEIYFPAATIAAESSAPPGAAAPRGGSETILLVEDEAGVRRIARLALEHRGYRVIEASSGQAAIDLADKHPGAIDLLITDVVMPGISGRKVAELVQARRPGIKILFMSGYIDDAVVRHGIVDSIDAFLHKPFSPLALTTRVRSVLAS